MMMTPRERVRTAQLHQQPDRTPYHIVFTQQMHARMVEYLGESAFLDRIGNHFTMLRAEPAGARVEVRPHIWRDQFGVHWDRSVDREDKRTAELGSPHWQEWQRHRSVACGTLTRVRDRSAGRPYRPACAHLAFAECDSHGRGNIGFGAH
jgi:hypothetical protein